MNCQWIGNKTKTGSSRLKTVRTADAVERVTNGGMRNLMHALAVRVVFDLLLPVSHFVADARTLVDYACELILWSSASSFFQ